MGTFPAPNFSQYDAVEAGNNSANAAATRFAEYTRAAAEQQQAQQSAAMAPLAQEQARQKIEDQRRQFADQDALTKALTQYDPQKHTVEDFPKLVTQNGGSGQAALNAQAGLVKKKQDLLKLSDDQFSHEQTIADLTAGLHDATTAAPADQKQDVYSNGLGRLARAGVDVSKEPAQYPGDEEFAKHLPAIRLHSAVIKQANEERELKVKEQEANAKDWKEFEGLGIAYNTRTHETKSVGGAGMMSPNMMESKYVALAAKKAAGQPLSKDDAAFMRGYQQYKTLVPVANFNLQANGVPLGGAPAAAASGKTGGAVADAVPANIKPTVTAVLEGRQSPPGSFALKTPYWQNVMNNVYALDPQWNEQRAQLRKAYTTGKQSTEINAINTAMGHVGILGDAIDALNNSDIKRLNQLANRLGVEIGNDNVTTFNTIVHRVGPELSKAYIGAGGSAGERGADEKDFDPSLGSKQLKSNVSITARLLRSKISSLENQWDQNKSDNMQSFGERFIMPEAKKQLDKWAPEAGAGQGASGQGASKAPELGSTITQNGHRYKVTKVENGKVTAADPI